MLLKFKSGAEFAELNIERENKKLVVTSSKTGYVPTKAKWTLLADPGQERRQMALLDTLDDKNFRLAVIQGMHQFGYELKSG